MSKEWGRLLLYITVILLISITVLTLHTTTNANPRIEEERSSICKTPYLPDMAIKDSDDQQQSRNVSNNDTEPPKAAPGTYSPISKGRFLEFDASGSTDNFPGLLENGTFNWTFIHYEEQLLQGIRVKFRFMVPGPYMIKLEVTDAAGNKNINSTTIQVMDDIKGPTMNRTETYPGNNEVDVALDVTPNIVFDDPGEFIPIIDDSTIDGNVSMFVHGSGIEVPFSFELSEDGKVLTLIPDMDLMKDRIYTITFGRNISDMAGNHLTEAGEFSFKTVESFRRERLEIEPNVPRGGDEVQISLFFNKKVDEACLNPEILSVTGPAGQVPLDLHFGTEGDDKENRSIVVVEFVSPVEYGAEYLLSISGLMADESGSQLGENPSHSFTTEKLDKVENETPLFFYFLLVLLVAVLLLVIYVVVERVKLRNSDGFSTAHEQLKSRKEQMRQLKRMDRQEMKEKKRAKEKKKGDREVSTKIKEDGTFEPLRRSKKDTGSDSPEDERFAPRRRSTRPESGKVTYYDPREISSFGGKTYDVEKTPHHGMGRRRERGGSFERETGGRGRSTRGRGRRGEEPGRRDRARSFERETGGRGRSTRGRRHPRDERGRRERRKDGRRVRPRDNRTEVDWG